MLYFKCSNVGFRLVRGYFTSLRLDKCSPCWNPGLRAAILVGRVPLSEDFLECSTHMQSAELYNQSVKYVSNHLIQWIWWSIRISSLGLSSSRPTISSLEGLTMVGRTCPLRYFGLTQFIQCRSWPLQFTPYASYVSEIPLKCFQLLLTIIQSLIFVRCSCCCESGSVHSLAMPMKYTWKVSSPCIKISCPSSKIPSSRLSSIISTWILKETLTCLSRLQWR